MTIRVLAHTVGAPSERVRRHEPLTFGVPLPKGMVKKETPWTMKTAGGSAAVQVRALQQWPDGSVRWALVDVQADIDGTEVQELSLNVQEAGAQTGSISRAVSLRERDGGLTIDTGAATFHCRVNGAFPFDAVEAGGHAAIDRSGSGLMLTDAAGCSHTVDVRAVEVEERGPLRSVVKLSGVLASGNGRHLAITGRVHFFAGLPTVRLVVTVTNQDRAKHDGGFWDLGDPGSILIKDLSLVFRLATTGDAEVYCAPEPGAPWTRYDAPFEIYQDSSGGDNWQSSNHVNRDRRVPNTFRGYRLRAGSRAQAGLRATPIVAVAQGTAGVAVTTPHFWQNFPKAIEVNGGALTLRLFPGQYGDLHEIQGGEQKTHELFAGFGPDGVTSVPLAWARARTVAGPAPEWCFQSDAVPFLAALNPDHASLAAAAIEGPDTFASKREKIDEYGWRHFGDIYGDHEAVRHKGATPLISHYNNQYDPIVGFGYQYLRSGDPRWSTMMGELAAHVIDIDTYHTAHDRSAYNQGMFWHTYHYGDADTGTHRSYPRAGQGKIHGGGPAADHDYARGLALHYYLTGDAASRDAVQALAQFVIDMDDGRKTIFRWLDRGATGRASMSYDGYHGPGRGPANSLDTLMSGHALTGDDRFKRKAEQLIRRVIHPADDIAARRLDIAEDHWYYTMFLQALGRYLDAKATAGETDQAYSYARASLLHYVRWMAEHEHPYLDKPEKLEFPTETWAAQDIRKADVFHLAAMHTCGEERGKFLERATFFFNYAVTSLRRMPTRTLARPVAVVLSSGHVPAWAAGRPDPPRIDAPEPSSFGVPLVFRQQRDRVKQRLRWIAIVGAAVSVGLASVLLLR